MDDEKDEPRSFRVTDRRRFAEEATAHQEEREPAEPGPPPGAERAAQPVTFATFLLGLSTQALMFLGEIDDPVEKARRRDLGAAKEMIDILGILREKTRTNLEAAEEELFEGILYDLRMRYVQLVRSAKEEA